MRSGSSAEFDIQEHFAQFEAALVVLIQTWRMDGAVGLGAEALAESVMAHFASIRNVVDKVKAER